MRRLGPRAMSIRGLAARPWPTAQPEFKAPRSVPTARQPADAMPAERPFADRKGNVYTHDTTAGRGVAADSSGVAAGRYATSWTAVNGTAVAGHGYAAYGTHPWSPTYYHSQAVAGRNWFYGNHLYTPGWCDDPSLGLDARRLRRRRLGRGCLDYGNLGLDRIVAGLCQRGTVQLQLRQFDRLPGRRGVLRQPAGRHRPTVLPGGREPRLDRRRRRTPTRNGCRWGSSG